MGARIIELSRAVAGKHPSGKEAGPAPAAPQRFEFWSGASGRRYVHCVYSLIECPELPRSNYVLVRRGSDGLARVLRIARATHEAPSLNLAEIRHRGAKAGANEVHVHLLANSDRERRVIEFDLLAAHSADQRPRKADA